MHPQRIFKTRPTGIIATDAAGQTAEFPAAIGA
jgi:hypothetical protein